MSDFVHETSNTCESDNTQLSASVGGRDDNRDMSTCRDRIRQLEAEVVALKRYRPLVEGATDRYELLKRLEVLHEQCSKAGSEEDNDYPRPSIENAYSNEKLQMELQDRMEKINLWHKTNEELVQKLSLFENQFAEQEKICSTDVNGKYSDTDDMIANFSALMETLSKNGRETQHLQSEITEFLRQRGFEANQEHVDELTSTFRESYARRSAFIRANNMMFEAIGVDNSVIRQHLHELQNDSISSSSMSFATPNESGRYLFEHSFADIIRIAEDDLVDITVELNREFGTVTERMSAFRQLKVLHEQCLTTGSEEDNKIVTLGETEEGRELLDKVKDLQLDLNKSMGEARFMADDKKTEKSLAEFCDVSGQLVELESLANMSRSIAAMHPLSMSALEDVQTSSDEEELKIEKPTREDVCSKARKEKTRKNQVRARMVTRFFEKNGSFS